MPTLAKQNRYVLSSSFISNTLSQSYTWCHRIWIQACINLWLTSSNRYSSQHTPSWTSRIGQKGCWQAGRIKQIENRCISRTANNHSFKFLRLHRFRLLQYVASNENASTMLPKNEINIWARLNQNSGQDVSAGFTLGEEHCQALTDKEGIIWPEEGQHWDNLCAYNGSFFN